MRSAAHADTDSPTEQGGSSLGERVVFRNSVAGSNPLRVRIGVSSGLVDNGRVGLWDVDNFQRLCRLPTPTSIQAKAG